MASMENTGGGEGIEVLVNEPFSEPQNPPLLDNRAHGQYTKKVFHLRSRVPLIVRAIAPKGSLELYENAWNAFPYCRTVVTNPGYMKENFIIKIESMHLSDRGTTENAHNLPPELLKMREVVNIDISKDKINPRDYKPEEDPSLVHSVKTNRGPLRDNWRAEVQPFMCAYKLVTCEFKWWGMQNRVERWIQEFEQRLFTKFHRQVFCWLDKWHGMTMDDVRVLEEKIKADLDHQRHHGETRGMQE